MKKSLEEFVRNFEGRIAMHIEKGKGNYSEGAIDAYSDCVNWIKELLADD